MEKYRIDVNRLTGPIAVGPVTVGGTEAEAFPFEPANVDYTILNEKQKTDPTYGRNQVPDAVVNSCSECCMQYVNGKPNVLGRLHKAMVKSCSRCPVGRAADHIQARDGQGRKLFRIGRDGIRRPMTQTEAMLMETDGST